MQWYGYVPGVLNVVVVTFPAAMFPVSHTPVSLVEVCAMPSVFFHVTVVPDVTVIVAGKKAIPDIVTTLDWVVAGVGLVGDDP